MFLNGEFSPKEIDVNKIIVLASVVKAKNQMETDLKSWYAIKLVTVVMSDDQRFQSRHDSWIDEPEDLKIYSFFRFFLQKLKTT